MTIEQIAEKIRDKVHFDTERLGNGPTGYQRGLEGTKYSVSLKVGGVEIVTKHNDITDAEVRELLLLKLATHLKELVYPREEERADYERWIQRLREVNPYAPPPARS